MLIQNGLKVAKKEEIIQRCDKAKKTTGETEIKLGNKENWRCLPVKGRKTNTEKDEQKLLYETFQLD